MLGKDQLKCLRVILNGEKIDIDTEDLMFYTERIKRNLQDIHIKDKREVMQDKGFPILIDEEILKFQNFS